MLQSKSASAHSKHVDGSSAQTREQVFATAFQLVMNKLGMGLKEDLVAKLKEQGLQFDTEDNPKMSIAELETGLYNLIGVGSNLIIRYIRAEMQKLE